MCYDAETATRKALNYAKHRNDDEGAIDRLTKQLQLLDLFSQPLYHVSGFAHPKLIVFTNKEPMIPRAFEWGLIPSWAKDRSIAKQTLNARGETIFEKPSFKTSANNKRCLIYLDAFYEHHHQDGKTYPFRISMKDDSPLCIAGLWEEWIDKETGEVVPTCTIVTTVGNSKMAAIHNNPKAEGPRMPVILLKERQDEWLSNSGEEYLKTLLQPFDENLLRYQTVGRLKGKDQLGNVQEVENDVIYPELTRCLQS